MVMGFVVEMVEGEEGVRGVRGEDSAAEEEISSSRADVAELGEHKIQML